MIVFLSASENPRAIAGSSIGESGESLYKTRGPGHDGRTIKDSWLELMGANGL